MYLKIKGRLSVYVVLTIENKLINYTETDNLLFEVCGKWYN